MPTILMNPEDAANGQEAIRILRQIVTSANQQATDAHGWEHRKIRATLWNEAATLIGHMDGDPSKYF